MTPLQGKLARTAMGWSIRKLAAEAKLSPNTVLAFESGRPVQPATLDAIGNVLWAGGITFGTLNGLDAVAWTPRG